MDIDVPESIIEMPSAERQDEINELHIKIAVLETKLEAADTARILQAKEYGRRLEELNHAHQQQMDRNADYVSRETWELRHAELEKELRVSREMLEARLFENERWRWIITGGAVVGGGILGAFISKLFQ